MNNVTLMTPRNTSDLRKVLLTTLKRFDAKEISIAEASAVVKITANVVRSLDADLAAQRLALEHNLPTYKLGELPLVNDEV